MFIGGFLRKFRLVLHLVLCTLYLLCNLHMPPISDFFNYICTYYVDMYILKILNVV